MIAKLRGLVDSVGADWAVIDVGGVGYLVFCSSRTLASLPAVGEGAGLSVETHVREDHIHLYGFATKREHEWFRILLTVQGVGAKVALAMLSALAPDALAAAIAAQDAKALSRANGVGPKLAARIVNELKDKAAGVGLAAVIHAVGEVAPVRPVAVEDAAAQDAVSALVNLGYGRTEAFAAIATARRHLGAEADLGTLVRGGLKELAP